MRRGDRVLRIHAIRAVLMRRIPCGAPVPGVHVFAHVETLGQALSVLAVRQRWAHAARASPRRPAPVAAAL